MTTPTEDTPTQKACIGCSQSPVHVPACPMHPNGCPTPNFTKHGVPSLDKVQQRAQSVTDSAKTYSTEQLRDAIGQIIEKRVDEAVKFVNPKFGYHGSYKAAVDEILTLFQKQQIQLVSELEVEVSDMWNPSDAEIYNRERHGEPNEVVYLDQLKARLQHKKQELERLQ